MLKSIKVLREKLSKENTFEYTTTHGEQVVAGFEWNPPLDKNDLDVFEEKNGINLPDDFKEFLMISNGAVLFEDIEYGGGGYKILGLNEIMEITKRRIEWGYELKDSWIIFAEVLGTSDFLLFDLEKLKTHKRCYIIDGDTGYPSSEWEYIKGNFTSWTDRLILVNGEMYWRWY